MRTIGYCCLILLSNYNHIVLGIADVPADEVETDSAWWGDQLEFVLDELIRPRIPPISGLDIVKGRYDRVAAQVGESIFRSTDPLLKQALGHLDSTNIQHIIETTSLDQIPGARYLGKLIMLDNGWSVRYLLRHLARTRVYPKLGALLVRMATSGIMHFTKDVMNILLDPIRQINQEYLVKMLGALINNKSPPYLFVTLLKGVHARLRSDAIQDFFLQSCNLEMNKFLEYLPYFQQLFPSALDTISIGRIREAEVSKFRFWKLRSLAVVFNDYRDDKKFKKGLATISRDDIEQSLRQVDWYLARSTLYPSILRGNLRAQEAFRHLLGLYSREISWRRLLRSNAHNMARAMLKLKLITFKRGPCLMVAKYGTVEMFSLAIDAGCQMTEESGLERATFQELSIGDREASLRLKRALLTLVLEIVRLKAKYPGQQPCTILGAPIVQIATRIDKCELMLPEAGDLQAIALTVMELFFNIPRASVPSLDGIPRITSITEYLNVALHQYCKARPKKKYNAVTFVRPEQLPPPKWYENKLYL